jgi:hypothetical protein
MRRIKEIITVDSRISMFQTAMNNAGRNFQGKRIPVEKMAKFASDFYKLAIKEISEIGKMELNQLEKIAVVKKRVMKQDVKKLLKKVSKRRRS